MTKPIVHIYSDGGCAPNPGPGGWAAVLVSPAHEKIRELFGHEKATTNNRMELLAAIRALESLKECCTVEFFTDSQYIQQAFVAGWLRNWKRNGWRTAAKKPVKNEDLWRELDALAAEHEIHWHWVKGHAGNAGNERADELVNYARKHKKSSDDEGE